MIRFVFFIWLAVIMLWIGWSVAYSGGSAWAMIGCFAVMVWFIRLAFPDRKREERKAARMVEFHAKRKLARSNFDDQVEQRVQEILKERAGA